MKESDLHDKTWLDGFVKETWQDKTGWKSQRSHDMPRLEEKIRPSWQDRAGWKSQAF